MLPAATAHADNLSDARATLSAAEAELAAVSSEYNAIAAQVAEIEKQIDEVAAKAEEAQQAMLQGQKELGKVMVSSYKSESANSLVNVFLASDTMEAFIRNVTYFNSIEEQKGAQIAEQRKRSEEFDKVLEELDQKRNEQEALIEQAAAKKSQAESIVASASARVSSVESEQARLAELQRQANALQTQPRPEAPISDNWNTGNGANSTTNNGTPATQTPTPSTKPGPTGSGWQTGIASAYGGSSDKTTPNPGRTATGAVCDDNSMGVAIPMSWTNYRSYLGRRVEISYNGRTVIATVNDCGGMGGGSRSLDLQPGVFKAFGFSTCQAWGLRTVSYRFL